MNIKRLIFVNFMILTLSSFLLFYAFKDRSEAKLNMIEVNDILQTIGQNWDTLGDKPLPDLNYDLEYVVLDNENNIVAATKSGLNTDINSAIINRDTIIDIEVNNTVLGKLIIYNDTNNIWQRYKSNLLTFTVAIMVFEAILCLLYGLYINKVIFHPFKKLRRFAKNVAEGKLDFPLEMDKGNKFGVFTESFDLMREELKKARESERNANRSKKELVAQLSHDIKTPVASIKAVTEIMSVKSQNEYEKKQLEVINTKADQINDLITNMFNATLEELQELKVTVTEQSSQIIEDLINEADYKKLVTITCANHCIVNIDTLRLSQVIDNIISNSYKYANTPIDVSITIERQYLVITFKDYGKGVTDDEVHLIFNKFYRGHNSIDKSGSGLGLYISKYLIEKMSGEIMCKNLSDGFAVIIKLLIL